MADVLDDVQVRFRPAAVGFPGSSHGPHHIVLALQVCGQDAEKGTELLEQLVVT